MVYPNIIYIDTLIIINLYVNFFLLKACGVILHRRIGTARCIWGAVAGGASSLVILFPALPAFMNVLVKIAIGAAIVLIAFGLGSFRAFLKNALVFIVINIIFAGFMLILHLFASPPGMVYNNGVVYLDISFLALVISTAAAYFLIRTMRYFLDVKFNAEKVYNVTFEYEGRSVSLSAFADSGNTLTDFFTGKPVIICDRSVFGENPPRKGIRLLPYNTVSSSDLLPVFKPDSVKIGEKNVDIMIGISKTAINKNGVNAIFNPKLLI